MKYLRSFLLITALAGTARPQNGSQFHDWRVNHWNASGDPGSVTNPKLACGDLRALTDGELTIASAVAIPAAGRSPEFCQVNGQILPAVEFEVSLPTAWNRRLYMFGNGGYAGEALDLPGRVNTRSLALQHGFAVAQTNTGHSAVKEPLGTFAVDRQKLLDYAFRSPHVTAKAAKHLAAAYYGTAPAKSYFDGCSTGGRQGLILAQRFPSDFDGIAVGAPVLNFTGTMEFDARISQALAANPLPASKLKLLSDTIYAQCDSKDGLKDGLISDPRDCHFEPVRDLPKCDASGDRADCFTSGQIETLNTIYTDLTSGGKRIFPGWPVGAEAAGANGKSGWDGWIVREGGPSTGTTFAETFFRYLAFAKPDASFSLSSFDPGRDHPRLEPIHELLDATDTDLSAFQRRGGKILMYFGWADPALNPLMGIDYYERVSKQMGPSTTDFFRLFMVPGMFHCGGGIGTSAFDAVTPLISWEEKSEAPDSILASRLTDGKVARTRPLCAYPEIAKYKGSGSIDEAASFTCSHP
ncbi:MAG: tannase/feruloyl esterase family alpha/beta hydrolase [Acidobacteriota bacterium]|nr:tannase/feruloyl esterase family alpha/beta hydrolase [Acidobacteriota bacterium]